MNLQKWLGLVQVFGPLILAAVKPQLAPIAGNIATGIQEAEFLKGQGKLTDKMLHVKNIASQAAEAVNTANGRVVIDKSSLDSSVQEAVDTVVAVTNLVHNKATAE